MVADLPVKPLSPPSSGHESDMAKPAAGPPVALIDLTVSEDEDNSEEPSPPDGRHNALEDDDDDWGNEEIEYADAEEQSSEADAPALDGPAREQLQAAVATVPIGRLREIAARLALTDPAVEGALARELLGLNAATRTLVARWAVCVHCGDEYSPQQQDTTMDCLIHPGVLEPDEAKFEDWDKATSGPTDTPQNRDDFPHKFIWSCCDADGTAPGCLQRHHESSRKRRRI